jgi:ribosomal protein L33
MLVSQTELSHQYMDSKKVARTAKKLRGRQKSYADGKKVACADSKKIGPNAGGDLKCQTELSHHYMDSKKVARTAKKLRGRQKSCADGKKVACADSKKIGSNAGGDLKCQTELSHHYMDSKKVARTAKKLCGQQKSWTKRWRGPQMFPDLEM